MIINNPLNLERVILASKNRKEKTKETIKPIEMIIGTA